MPPPKFRGYGLTRHDPIIKNRADCGTPEKAPAGLADPPGRDAFCLGHICTSQAALAGLSIGNPEEHFSLQVLLLSNNCPTTLALTRWRWVRLGGLIFASHSSLALHPHAQTQLHQKLTKTDALAGFKEALRPFSVERPRSRSGTYSGRFGSDFGAPPGRISNSWLVTTIFAL